MKYKNNNTGSENTGESNSGNGNSGNGNSGYRNSGNGNSGNRNSGNWNSGNWNSGNGNSTNRESGIFCSEETTIRMFNKPTDKKWDEIDHPHFIEFWLTKWIEENEMTDAEKAASPEFCVLGGYLKTFTWAEVWSNFWKDTDEENRQKFLSLPNFDAKIFKSITGIDVKIKSLSGKIVKVEIDGEEYEATIN